jgi:hypothetical protein
VEGSKLEKCGEAWQCVGDSEARKLEGRAKGDCVCILQSVGQVISVPVSEVLCSIPALGLWECNSDGVSMELTGKNNLYSDELFCIAFSCYICSVNQHCE